MSSRPPSRRRRRSCARRGSRSSPGGSRWILGCGPGAHAMALGRAGVEVHAIDGCLSLLEELRGRRSGANIHVVHADLIRFREHFHGEADAVLCLGDTLTHLSSEDAVAGLLRDCAAVLRAGGVFVTTFRDYTGPGPVGPARFIPVRSDADRILTCCIEYEEKTVTVTDLIHERRGTSWDFRASSYTKLRLDPAWVVQILGEAGLSARRDAGPRGMVRITGKRA
ncbi:MAG: class I SAM-dependent methyltransferase [Minicystis sp.]